MQGFIQGLTDLCFWFKGLSFKTQIEIELNFFFKSLTQSQIEF